jgi:hypothetical protein
MSSAHRPSAGAAIEAAGPLQTTVEVGPEFLVRRVRGRGEGAHDQLAAASMIADVIHDDTGLPASESRLLAVSLVGMAQVSARFWVSESSGLTQEQAIELVSGLAWRGIRGYPLTEDH